MLGIVVKIDDDNDIVVSYPSGNRWTFNPAVLTKVLGQTQSNSSATTSANVTSNDSSNEFSFEVGDIVQITNDLARIKLLQKNHGDWTDAMMSVSCMFLKSLNLSSKSGSNFLKTRNKIDRTAYLISFQKWSTF